MKVSSICVRQILSLFGKKEIQMIDILPLRLTLPLKLIQLTNSLLPNVHIYIYKVMMKIREGIIGKRLDFIQNPYSAALVHLPTGSLSWHY